MTPGIVVSPDKLGNRAGERGIMGEVEVSLATAGADPFEANEDCPVSREINLKDALDYLFKNEYTEAGYLS